VRKNAGDGFKTVSLETRRGLDAFMHQLLKMVCTHLENAL
jgi:hypothetical protein